MLMFKTCKFRFKLVYLLGVEYIANVAMEKGTYLHTIFDRFFDEVDTEKIWLMRFEPINMTNIRLSNLYDYIYSVLINLGDPSVRHNIWYKYAVNGFAMFETIHALNIFQTYSTLESFNRYFLPQAREQFLVDHDLQIYGTIDRVNLDYGPEKTLIIDYKTTSYYAKPVFYDEVKNGYSTKLPTRYVKEGNFYVLLHALQHYNIGTDDRGKLVFLDERGDIINISDRYDYGFLFVPTSDLPGKPFIFARKRASILSIRNIVRFLTKMRTETLFERCDIPFLCQRCPYYEEYCKSHLPKTDSTVAFL